MGEASFSWENAQGFTAKLLLPEGLQGEIELVSDEPLYVQEEGKTAVLYEPKEGKIRAFIDGNACIFPLIN